MLISRDNLEIRHKLTAYDKKIETLHLEFYKYYHGQEKKMPLWEDFDRELIDFSRRKISDLELSKNLDRILYKYQNRKKIWMTWAEELRHVPNKKESSEEEPIKIETQSDAISQ